MIRKRQQALGFGRLPRSGPRVLVGLALTGSRFWDALAEEARRVANSTCPRKTLPLGAENLSLEQLDSLLNNIVLNQLSEWQNRLYAENRYMPASAPQERRMQAKEQLQ